MRKTYLPPTLKIAIVRPYESRYVCQMAIKILNTFVLLSVLFLGYIGTRSGEFHYERSAVINAPAQKIYPLVSNFRLSHQWHPSAIKDPNLVTRFFGPDAEVGSVMEYDGIADAGSGRLEITKLSPNESVEIKSMQIKPIAILSDYQYKLTPEGNGTRFTWTMSGDGGYLEKLASFFGNGEKTVARDLELGIQKLKSLSEAP